MNAENSRLALTALLAIVILVQAESYRWSNVPVGGGGYVTGIAIHPTRTNRMYIRTDVGGAYRWDSAGQQWSQLLNWVGPSNANLIGVDGLALDPRLPDRVYLALGKSSGSDGGVYRSDNCGQTWSRLLTARFDGNGRDQRWSGECLAVDPRTSDVVYCGTRLDGNGLWRTTDGGVRFTKISAFSTAGLFSWGAPAPGSTTLTAYCCGTVGGVLGLYRSLDMGTLWTRINDNEHQFPSGAKSLAADRQVFGRVYVGSGGCGIFMGESADRPVEAMTWEPVAGAHEDPRYPMSTVIMHAEPLRQSRQVFDFLGRPVIGAPFRSQGKAAGPRVERACTPRSGQTQ